MEEKKSIIPFFGCNLSIIHHAGFLCKRGYVYLYSKDNNKLILKDINAGSRFNYSQIIHCDFCEGGIEIGFDVFLGKSWPLKQKFVHGEKFNDKIVNLNVLKITIYGTAISPKVEIIDGSENKWNL